MSLFVVILACIFPHLDWIRRDTEYLSVFSPNVGKFGPYQLRIRTLLTQCTLLLFVFKIVESLQCILNKPLILFVEHVYWLLVMFIHYKALWLKRSFKLNIYLSVNYIRKLVTFLEVEIIHKVFYNFVDTLFKKLNQNRKPEIFLVHFFVNFHNFRKINSCFVKISKNQSKFQGAIWTSYICLV